jgi:Bacterial lectin
MCWKYRFIVMMAVLLSGIRIATAQPNIYYPTFLFNAPFQTNGNGKGVMYSTLLLNDGSAANQNGSIFVNTPQDLTQSFTAQYSFLMADSQYGSGSGPGGIAFVIEGDSRGDTALGGGGQQLGYGDGQALNNNAIQNSLALTYNSYGGADQFQLFANTSNSNFNTLTSPLATQTGSENLYDVYYPSVTLDYQAPDLTYPNGAVTVLLNGNSIGLNNVSLPASLTSLAGGSTGYFGFTATNGSPDSPQIAVTSLVATGVPEPGSLCILSVGASLLLRRRRISYVGRDSSRRIGPSAE